MPREYRAPVTWRASDPRLWPSQEEAIEDCYRLTRERDEARAKAIMDRQAQHAIELALVAERDEARARQVLLEPVLDKLTAERDRLKAALERIARGHYAGASYLALTALEGRDA